MGLLPIETASQGRLIYVKSRRLVLVSSANGMCSRAGIEGWHLVTPDHLFCMRDVSHRYMDTFFIGPVVAVQEVV